MAFWGLILEPKKQYSQTVEQPFHISMAALDMSSSDAGEESSSVVLRRDGGDFILCNLSRKHKLLNVPLNLDFEVGDEINFYVNGNSNIHLTGFIGDDSMEGFDSDMSGEEEEDDEEMNTSRSPLLKSTKKLLDQESKRKAVSEKSNVAKKAKLSEMDDDDDSEDSDFDLDDSDADLGGEEEEEDDDDEDEEDDSDDDPEAILKKLAEARKQDNQAKKEKAKQAGKQEVQQGGKAHPQAQGKANKEKQNKQQQQQKGANAINKPANEKQESDGVLKRFKEHGILIEELRVGSGPAAQSGKMVTVYYVGRLRNNNKKFDESQSGPGFKFRLGRGEVIKGWDIGVRGMRVGGKRRLTIPPNLAYGKDGSPPVIPANSSLVFEVELRDVGKN